MDMLQSCTYVWKIETVRDEENVAITDEERASRPAADDYGNA